MQTFANVFRGIVNIISNISCDDVEDFASACIVIALCTGAIKMFMDLLKRVHTQYFAIIIIVNNGRRFSPDDPKG